jgi:hypothetical protein
VTGFHGQSVVAYTWTPACLLTSAYYTITGKAIAEKCALICTVATQYLVIANVPRAQCMQCLHEE